MTDIHDASTIKVLNLSDNDNYVPTIDPVFAVLGMLNEYSGRRGVDVRGEERVELFYPKEEPIAEKFIEYLKEIAVHHHLSHDIDVSIGPQGHIIVSSLDLARFIKALYGKNDIDSFHANAILTNEAGQKFRPEVFCIAEAMFAPLPPAGRPFLFNANPVDQRFSYLFGAHLRYGSGNRFELYNASHKVDLIIDFLERLGAKWVSRAWNVDGAPRLTKITFAPGPCLARFLGLQPMELDTFSEV